MFSNWSIEIILVGQTSKCWTSLHMLSSFAWNSWFIPNAVSYTSELTCQVWKEAGARSTESWHRRSLKRERLMHMEIITANLHFFVSSQCFHIFFFPVWPVIFYCLHTNPTVWPLKLFPPQRLKPETPLDPIIEWTNADTRVLHHILSSFNIVLTFISLCHIFVVII